MTDICNAVEETCAGALSGGACEDSVFEGLGLQTTAGAGGIGLGGPPGGVRHQVAFPGSHLCIRPATNLPRPIKG